MTIASRVKSRPILALIILMAASLAGLLLLPPIAQDQNYHQFADQRKLLGIPNFWTVFSNLPFIAVLQLFGPKYTGARYWLAAAALYALAKLFEFYDDSIFSAGALLSGHTLKHLAAAAACFAVLRLFQNRQPIGGSTTLL